MRSLVALLSRLAPPAAALILLVSGCTDEKIVYRDREAFNPPPEEALGFLGYFAATDQQTTCGNCHVGQQAEWAGTRHAGAWATLQASGHAQAFCEGCHTVNQLGNAATEPSGYAAVPDTSYHDVQCESCHGAGLDHVMNPDGTQPLASIKAALDADNGCGECHQGTHHPFVEEWEQSAHATPVQTVVDRAVSDPAHYGTCVDCHTAQGALAAWGIRDEYVEKNDPVQNHLGIVCAVCHDPHNGDFEGQTRFPVDVPSQEQNLCIKCHYKRAEPEVGAEVIRGPHSPEGPLLLGEGAGWFPPGFEPEVDRILGTHGTDNNPRLCATCHIYNYEVTDQATGEFLVQSVGHLFNAIPCVDAQGVPTPETDCDVSQRQFGGCTESGCHGSPDAARSAYLTANQRIADLVAEVDALLAQPAVAADFNLNDGVFTVADGAWFNNELAQLPGTPTHNPFLAEQLLVASINAIQATYGVTAPLTGISLERQLREQDSRVPASGPAPVRSPGGRRPASEPPSRECLRDMLPALQAMAFLQAAAVHAAALQDTVRVRAPQDGAVIESVAVTSPLPDPLVPVVQWFFQKPEWVMISGIVLAAVLAVAVLVFLWKRWGPLVRWLVARDRGVKLAMLGGVAVVLLLVAGTGWKAYDYMMHDNDFCRGCHIFVPSGQLAVRPDTGNYLLVNAVEGPHSELQCHACHPFEIEAQTRELIAWMTARPEAVPPHAKVPRDVCESCHVRGEADSTWQRVAATAGHRVHLESDSLQGEIECLTCHARTAHRFVPADSTCGQNGCHVSTEIRLAAMRDQTELHCVTCHEFTADVPALATRDSAAGTLRPALEQCNSCHAMQRFIAEFEPENDPHGATCGMCHNPHEQETPEAAAETCADAGCHADWRAVRFHVGANHDQVAERCITCHQPHAARVDASDCAGCHNEVRSRSGGRMRPPLPFDTTAALRQSASVPPEPARQLRGKGDAPPDEPRAPPWEGRSVLPAAAPPDTFSHDQHRRLSCITCHTTGEGEGLTFEPPRGCQICHHQAPRDARCADCHASDELAGAHPVTVTVRVPDHAPAERPVAFEHDEHGELACVACHTTPVSLEPAEPVRTCADCHDEHHDDGRDCAVCHAPVEPRKAHADLGVRAHQACGDCHTGQTVGRLVPSRSFCLTCHAEQREHYPERECSVCHLQQPPERFRPRLLRTGGAP